MFPKRKGWHVRLGLHKGASLQEKYKNTKVASYNSKQQHRVQYTNKKQ